MATDSCPSDCIQAHRLFSPLPFPSLSFRRLIWRLFTDKSPCVSRGGAPRGKTTDRVTLLTDFETAPSPTSWTLGTHGLRISFSVQSRRYGATYLPDVPVEQGWTKEETLLSLMRKAGWTGRKDDWRRVADLRVVRYQGKKVTMRYDEWSSWRWWAERAGYI